MGATKIEWKNSCQSHFKLLKTLKLKKYWFHLNITIFGAIKVYDSNLHAVVTDRNGGSVHVSEKWSGKEESLKKLVKSSWKAWSSDIVTEYWFHLKKINNLKLDATATPEIYYGSDPSK